VGIDPASGSFRVGLSGLLRYANMKSVPGLVMIISAPSNLTSMSMMKPYHTKKPRRVRVTPGLPSRDRDDAGWEPAMRSYHNIALL
jgi:hypothetical protein